jgi:hypothetical protein
MLAAGLVAKKAVERGLDRKPWVKTSLAPGSKVVTEYLHEAALDLQTGRAQNYLLVLVVGVLILVGLYLALWSGQSVGLAVVP